MFRYLFTFNVINNDGSLGFINVYKDLSGPIEQSVNPRELILEIEDNVRHNLNCAEVDEDGKELPQDEGRLAKLVLVQNIISLWYKPKK